MPLCRQCLRHTYPIATQGALRRSIAEHALLLHGIVVRKLSLSGVDHLLGVRVRIARNIFRSQWLRGVVRIIGGLLDIRLRKAGTLVDGPDAKVLLCIDGGNQFPAVGLIGGRGYRSCPVQKTTVSSTCLWIGGSCGRVVF